MAQRNRKRRDAPGGRGLRALAAAVFAVAFLAFLPRTEGKVTAHSFEFPGIAGGTLPMKDFAGRPVLVVNTASECGFTPQYKDLQALWRDYRERGLVVLGVPSNDFGGQEPGSEAEIKQFCELNYGIDFPMTGKQKVIGQDAHPFYRWIATELGEDHAPRWNFHKYLVSPDGELVGAWPSRVAPTGPEIREAVETYLAK